MSGREGDLVTVVDVVLPTVAVVLSWLFLIALLAGCGFLARSIALRLLAEPAARPATADLWIGFALLIAYLQLWNLAFRISWVAWVAPLGFGLAGLLAAVRAVRPLRRPRLPIALVVLTGLGILWVANRALAAAEDYDLGLYHFAVIGYALKYPTLPGLGNLEERLGAGDAHLLFVAFLQHGPWAKIGYHLANGLLVTMLFLELASRLAVQRLLHWPASFTTRLAMLLVPATVIAVGVRPTHRVSSPNLDLAAFVLIAVGTLYLSECVERGFPSTAILTATAAFAVASATRPLYWVTTLFALVVVAFAAGRDRKQFRLGLLRAPVLACALPAVLLLGWMARQAILSGYPLFPTTIGGLDVDWRVPASVIHDQNRTDYAWARLPGIDPTVVFGSWHWVTSWWLPKRSRDIDVIAPLLLLGCLIPAAGRRADLERRTRTRPMLAVLVPSLISISIWFFTAPDPRFVFAPIWLVPIALAAWALPGTDRPLPKGLLLAAAAGCAGLIAVGVTHPSWLVPVALTGGVVAATVSAVWSSRSTSSGTGGLVARAALVAVVLAPIGIVYDGGAFGIVVSNHSGPLGTLPERTPILELFSTNSNFELWKPVDTDQCFMIEPCTQSINYRLRLRGAGIGDGFSVSP